MKPAEFRTELNKIMPGYRWTVRRDAHPADDHLLVAIGTQSSGFNRLSTLRVARTENDDGSVIYHAASAGFGRRARWLHEHRAETLPRALRGLQQFYQTMANEYRSHAHALQRGRKPEGGGL